MVMPPLAPRVSVLVPAYGVTQFLAEALESLKAQSCPEWEAIVVDDGAAQEVEAALSPFLTDERIRLLKTDHAGLAAARNRAASSARAPWLALLDGDDAYYPTYIETMLASIDEDREADFVTCDATYFGIDRHGERFSAYYPQAGPLNLTRVVSRDFNVFVGCLIRRDALLAVGGFDEDLPSVEDLDLWIRLLAAGYRGTLFPEPLVRYRRRTDSLSANTRAMLRATRNVYKKALTLLDDRPERSDALKMLERLDREQAWLDGEDRIATGDIHQGISMMKGVERRSLRWQIAMPIMRMFPMLAKPMLRVRQYLPEPRKR